MSIQSCPAPDCEATYAPAVIEETTRCPECNTVVIECPICMDIIRLGVVWDTDQCPACGHHRLDLGDSVRDAPDEMKGSADGSEVVADG